MNNPAPAILDVPAPAPAPDPAPDPIVGDPPAPTPDPAAPAPAAGDPPAGDWPEDWRQKYSTDPAVQKRLERYGSPKAALDALFAAQTRISKGDILPALKDNPTAEDIAEYRNSHGIPETPDKYDLTLPNGLVIGEADKPFVDEFLTKAHEQNMHPKQVQEALGWYFDKQEKAVAEQEARDQEHRIACVDELRNEFGPDYKREVKIAMDVLDTAPADVKDRFLGGRLADGTMIGNDPAVIRWLNTLSRELNPIGTVVPGSGTNAAQAVQSEMTELRALMGDHNSAYWKGPAAAAKQARYKQLVEASSKGR